MTIPTMGTEIAVRHAKGIMPKNRASPLPSQRRTGRRIPVTMRTVTIVAKKHLRSICTTSAE